VDVLVLLGAQVLDARQRDFAVAAVGAAGLLLDGVEGVVAACVGVCVCTCVCVSVEL
jgi:hypothetical protein